MLRVPVTSPESTRMLNTTSFRNPHGLGLAAVIALVLTGCEGTTLGHFDVDEPLPSTRVEGRGAVSFLPLAFPAMELDVNSSQEFQSQEYDYLTSIQLDSLQIQMTPESTQASEDSLEDGEDDNFNFLSSIEIFIQAEIDDVLQRLLVGSIAESDVQLSESRQSISFTMTGADILAYVEAEGGYEVQIQARGDAPPDAVIFDGDVVYRVGIGFR